MSLIPERGALVVGVPVNGTAMHAMLTMPIQTRVNRWIKIWVCTDYDTSMQVHACTNQNPCTADGRCCPGECARCWATVQCDEKGAVQPVERDLFHGMVRGHTLQSLQLQLACVIKQAV